MSAGMAVREWRTRRRVSPMELAHQVGVSPRHLSFVETGKAASRALLLRIDESLDLPLAARNRLLLDGGYAPAFGEHTLDAERMRPVNAAIDSVLAGHAPYPAVVTDACWNLLAANVGCVVLTEGVDPELLRPPINVMKLCLHPRGLAQQLLNRAEVHAAILGRVRRHALSTAAPDIRRLYEELLSYPAPEANHRGEQTGELYVPFRMVTWTPPNFGSSAPSQPLAVHSTFPWRASSSSRSFLPTRPPPITCAGSTAINVSATSRSGTRRRSVTSAPASAPQAA